MDETTIPDILHRFAEQLTADCGHPATVTIIEPYLRWRVVVDSGRVYLTCDYKRFKRGRYLLHTSTLSLDGERIPLAQSYDACVWTIKHPELYPTPMPIEVDFDEPAYPLPEAELADAPAVVRRAHRRLLDKSEFVQRIHVGHLGPRWTITADCVDNLEIRQHWMTRLSAETLTEKVYHRRLRHREVFVNGVDITDSLDENSARILGLLANNGDTHSETPGATGPVARAHGPIATTTSVRVKKIAVIRT